MRRYNVSSRPESLPNAIILLIGLWLAASAYFENGASRDIVPASPADLNFLMSGVAAITIASTAVLRFGEWLEWAAFLLGAWLILSPWTLAFFDDSFALGNAMLCGFAIVACATVALVRKDLEGS